MSAPSLDKRRTQEFLAELLARARAWIPSWSLADDERDFGRALLEIAARFSGEVAERLDHAGDKMQGGLLDWLAVRGQAARPARVPVAFKLTDAAQEAVLAPHPVRMQAPAGDASVIFETEADVQIVRGRLDVVVGADADGDAYYLPPPGLSDLQPLEPLPTEWRLKSFAATGAKRLQLDPDTGLAADMIVEADGRQYRIVGADKDIVTIDPVLTADLAVSTIVRKVTAFAPFDGAARNRQQHALYLGDMELFDLEAAATIDVVGAQGMRAGIDWQYWGKVDGGEEKADWQSLTVADEVDQKNDALVLKKGKGSIDPAPIGDSNSRWLRGFTTNVTGAPAQVDALEVRINCTAVQTPPATPSPDAAPPAEAMANTTPIVLDSVFFPLGKEPRQFDAFYLGSKEAFSKKGAEVELQFELADPTFAALAAVRTGIFADGTLAGVAKDRALHLFHIDRASGALTKLRDREPLQPPMPGYKGDVAPGAGSTVALDAQPGWRPPIWSEFDTAVAGVATLPVGVQGFLVAVTAGDAIWIWREHPYASESGWVEFDTLPPSANTPPPKITGLVYLGGAAPTLVALREGEDHMYTRAWPNGAAWTPVLTKDGGTTVKLKSIVPVLVDSSGQLVTSTTAGMVGISDTNILYSVTPGGACTAVPVATTVNADVQPVAIVLPGGSRITAAVTTATTTTPPALVAYRTNVPAAQALQQAPLDPNATAIGGLEAFVIGGTPHILASIDGVGDGRVASWAPYAPGALAAELESPVAAGGMPTIVAGHVVVPGKNADIFAAEFDPSRRIVRRAPIDFGILVPQSSTALVVNDVIVRGGSPIRRISQALTSSGGDVLYRLDAALPVLAVGAPPEPIMAYHLADELTGVVMAPDQLELDGGDQDTDVDTRLVIGGALYRVNAIDRVPTPPVVTLDALFGAPQTPTTGKYVRPIVISGRAAPFMRLDQTNGDWDAELLTRLPLIFLALTPRVQAAEAFSTILKRPSLVVLANEFQPVVAGTAEFLLDLGFGEWQRQLGNTATNPQLSWEYWNGRGWWALDIDSDETFNLKTSGVVRFEVPSDIASSDWAGKTNFWIRARLVGGDYGREEVTVVIKDQGNGVTQQTVLRSMAGIRPPSVVKLYISYRVCTSVLPTYVVTEDSGSRRDQSDANRTPGAIVEAFVPLAVTLGRLSRPTAAATPSPAAQPSDCGCAGSPATQATPPATPAARPPDCDDCEDSQAPGGSTQRSLFIGLTLPPSDGPVRVLLLVDEERNHAAFAPMTVEALISDRFEPVVGDDASRAVGESGLLTMNFTLPPTPRNLFGRSCAWLRLIPAARASANQWKPALKGAYLNAVWASAMETLTRELVGSSDGEPGLTFTLARPPLLRDTLELRVKEPLGDEERNQLRQRDAQMVLSDVVELEGYWVLWRRVVDPGDEEPGARVYALDEESGRIRFGDGQHGKIPPIGRDSIVAFSYRRTERGAEGSNDVPGNLVTPRTQLNLVSPLSTVESAIAADQAAGGTPPESTERVVRFGGARLRHRERAVTARDLEDIALESSPDIVQARCLLRRSYARLVVVMRGKDPRPNAAQIRELGRLLRAAGPASLSEPGALRIEAPLIRRLRVDLELKIDRLDNAGAVGVAAKQRLAAFFDTLTGGTGKDGWKLGDRPTEEDVAFALTDAPHLDSISSVTLLESAGGGSGSPWPQALKPNELIVLADDPIGVRLVPVEEAA